MYGGITRKFDAPATSVIHSPYHSQILSVTSLGNFWRLAPGRLVFLLHRRRHHTVKGASPMQRVLPLVLLILATTSTAKAEPPASSETIRAQNAQAPAKVVINPLDLRWTFGNHEPVSMYRRIGRKSTGGIEGGALWLEDWHHWFDSEQCLATMEQLGLNILHSRFYKGMGWEFESKDFPRVKQFVENCHKHNIQVLAYVQFSTLYYETMLAEIPDLATWAALDYNGHKQRYNGKDYFRWLPCINAPGFEAYLKKVIHIALTEGDFDGIMFDNCMMPPCFCNRCTELFRDHLRREPNPETRFGLPTVDHILPPPRSRSGEIKDPIQQQWVHFRCQRMTALMKRLFEFSKSCKSSAIVTGNVVCTHSGSASRNSSLDAAGLTDCFDLLLWQSGNEPGMTNGYLINRVRLMKLAAALNAPVLALSDGDAGISDDAESKYVLNLMENAVFRGIPTDRTVMKPEPGDMVSRQLIEFRKPLLKQFTNTIQTERASFEAPTYAPVRVLYSADSTMFSKQSENSILNAEEILMRHHVPWGLVHSSAERGLDIPKDCRVLLVCNQACLSDEQLEAIVRFAERGGRLIVTGSSGDCDEWYRQRRENPLTCLNDRPGVIRRLQADVPRVASGGWTIKVKLPQDGGQRLLHELDTIYKPAIRIQGPDTVLAEVKRHEHGFFVHLLNYAQTPVAKGIRIELPGDTLAATQCSFALPMDGQAAKQLPVEQDADGHFVVVLPEFKDYALVTLQTPTR